MQCTCDNCGWQGDERETREISDFWSRVDPGQIVPSGQCPKCGALAYGACSLDAQDVTQLTRLTGDTGFTVTNMDDGLQVEVRSVRLHQNDHLNIRLTNEGIIIDGVKDGEVPVTWANTWNELEHNYLEPEE